MAIEIIYTIFNTKRDQTVSHFIEISVNIFRFWSQIYRIAIYHRNAIKLTTKESNFDT